MEKKDKLKKFLEENNIDIYPVLNFPQYNILPDDLKLALAVIVKHNPQFNLTLKNKEGKKLTNKK